MAELEDVDRWIYEVYAVPVRYEVLVYGTFFPIDNTVRLDDLLKEDGEVTEGWKRVVLQEEEIEQRAGALGRQLVPVITRNNGEVYLNKIQYKHTNLSEEEKVEAILKLLREWQEWWLGKGEMPGKPVKWGADGRTFRAEMRVEEK